MRRASIFLLLCLTLASLAAFAALPQSPADFPQSPELKKLDAWTGRWTTKGKLYDTPLSHAGEISITMTCGWSAYGGFMICDHLISGPSGKHNDLSVFTFNPADHSYKFCGLDRSGVPRATPLTIQGNVWSYDSDDDLDGKKVHVKTINDFSKPGVVTWNTKYTSDGGAHWTLMNEGVDTLVH